MSVSIAITQVISDWATSRFADLDMFMREVGEGVGHCAFHFEKVDSDMEDDDDGSMYSEKGDDEEEQNQADEMDVDLDFQDGEGLGILDGDDFEDFDTPIDENHLLSETQGGHIELGIGWEDEFGPEDGERDEF